MAFEYALKQAGLDTEKDVLLDNSVQFDMMTGAFLGGTGDYVTMFEPAASSVEAEGKGYIVASVGEAAGEIPIRHTLPRKVTWKKMPISSSALPMRWQRARNGWPGTRRRKLPR